VLSESSLQVLLVDDDEELRELLATRLAASGHSVTVASDGLQAVRLARAGRPDVIVLDMVMPAMSGWEALPLLRSLGPGKRPRVIALSGNDDARSRERAFELGCDEYIVKSDAPEALAGALRAVQLRSQSRT